MAGEGEETDTDEASLGERGARAFRQHLAGAAEEEDTLEVQDEPEEDEPETEVAPSRQERRTRRGAERVSSRERAAAAEAEAKVLREQLETERTRAAQLPQSQAQRQGNPVEHIDREYRATIEEMGKLDEEYARLVQEKKLTTQQDRDMREKWANLDLKKGTLIVERREVLTAPKREAEARQNALRSRFPDVYGNPKAHQYAAALWNMETARGAAEDDALHEQVMARTREEFLGKRPPPSAASKNRASGMSAGARPAPGGKVEVKMPRGQEIDRMARAAYPNLEPAQARQKWANRNGAAYSEMLKSRG